MQVSDTHSEVLESARKFIANEIAPNASLADAKEEFRLSTFKEMGQLGLLGLPYPEEYGGVGLGYDVYYQLVREIASACASTAMSVIAHTSLASGPIFRFGTEKQKDRHLRPLAAGEKVGAFALTEPNAGSDIGGIELSAEQQGDRYVLNGSKIFITNANVADTYIVAARTSPGKGMLGISLFIVERGTPGLRTSGKKEPMLGMRAADGGEIFFDDVAVPSENLISRRGLGLKVLHHTLVEARVGMAALALGISEAAQKLCLDYVKQRKQFGKLIYHFQSVGNMLADMTTGVSASELLVSKAAAGIQEGRDVSLDASIAKLFASEVATRTTKDAIQIFGGYGYSRQYPLERFFRDAKLTEIGDGTSEIQRMIIIEELVKGRGLS